ncbi:hypothetical protein D3C84_1140760 [compost metagenome]
MLLVAVHIVNAPEADWENYRFTFWVVFNSRRVIAGRVVASDDLWRAGPSFRKNGKQPLVGSREVI